jgi:hypothetical protein
MSGKEYSCLFFNDIECPKKSRFVGIGCWCDNAEARKAEDNPKSLTTKEAIFLGFINSK